MTDYINNSQANLGMDYPGTTTTSDFEYVKRVLHSIIVSERMRGWDAYRDGIDEPLQRPERVIARANREAGWVTIPLVGDEAEDVLAYAEGGDFEPRQWGFSHGARPLLGPRRRWGEPIPPIHLGRRGMELVLLARYFIHASGDEIMDSMTGTVPQAWALGMAQSALIAERLYALGLLADSVGFRGTQEQRLRQLEWLLDGEEPSAVACRHCYQIVEPSDPFLTVDLECEADRHNREHDSLPRFSAHAMCYADHFLDRSNKDDDYHGVDYQPNSSWIAIEQYKLRWAIKEQRNGEIHLRKLAAELAALPFAALRAALGRG